MSYNKEKKYKNQLISIGLIFLLIITYIISIQKRNVQKIKKELVKKEDLTSDYHQKGEKVREMLSQRFEISKRLAILESYSNEKDIRVWRKINEVIYGSAEANFNWEEFYLLLNELYDNISFKLGTAYPNLTQDDIHFCCLAQAGFNNGEIAFILDISPNTVRMRKTSIRKKIGITDGCDLKIFCEKFLRNFAKNPQYTLS